MVDNKWFLEALQDVKKFAENEGIDNILTGLAGVIETYCLEAGMDEAEILGLKKELLT